MYRRDPEAGRSNQIEGVAIEMAGTIQSMPEGVGKVREPSKRSTRRADMFDEEKSAPRPEDPEDFFISSSRTLNGAEHESGNHCVK